MPEPRNKRKARTWRTILIVVALLIVAGILYGVKEYFRTNKDLQDEPAVASLTASALIQAFEQDSAKSNQQYVDKIIAVTGPVKSIQADDNPVVITLGEEGVMSSVQCSMDSTHTAAASKIAVGKSVTIKGMCTGAISEELFGTDVKLNRCVLQTESGH
jgi:hypothetical protein